MAEFDQIDLEMKCAANAILVCIRSDTQRVVPRCYLIVSFSRETDGDLRCTEI